MLVAWAAVDHPVVGVRYEQQPRFAPVERFARQNVGGGQIGGPGGGSDTTSAQIATWVEANFTATTVGGQTVYDLTT